jgi:hypothetical protein
LIKAFVPTNRENQIPLKKDLDKKAQFEFLVDVLRSKDEWRTRVEFENLSVVDWKSVVELSLDHGVSAHFLERLTKHEKLMHVPDEIIRMLKAIGLRTAVANTKRFFELAVVLQALQKEAIPVIVLKGAHLAEIVYANVALRPMDDLDILVAKKDITRVERTLFEMGYVYHDGDTAKTIEAGAHHLSPLVKKDSTPIEVHRALPYMGDLDKGVEEIWGRAQLVTIAGCRALVLSPEDVLVHAATHASLTHRFFIGLRPLYDISAIATHYHAVLDWEKVSSYAQHWGVRNAVYLTLRIANELIGAGVPDRALQTIAPPQFDPTLLDWAKEQIFTRSMEFADSLSVSPRLARFWGSGWSKSNMTYLFHLAFPPREDIARMYGLPSTSLRFCHYYLVFWKSLLIHRGGVIWRLVRRDKTAIAKAELYQKLIDYPP